MGGKASRTKGHNFERAVARFFRPLFPGARRGEQFTGGREADVEETPFRIECKRQAKWTSGEARRALEQAEGDAHKWNDARPIVAVLRADREESYVFMKMTTAASIVEKFFWRPEGAKIIHFPKEKK